MKKEEIRELVEDNPNVIYAEEFFDKMKGTSLLDFRRNINLVQEIKPTLFLESKVLDYYDELLNCYNKETKLFNSYDILMERLIKRDYDGLGDSDLINEFISKDILVQMQDFYFHHDGEKESYQYLFKNTSRIISEIVIDGLFGDTLYNVFLNIKEMIRFHELLNDKEKILRQEDVLFYQNILSIDHWSNEEKIKKYAELKGKDIGKKFYFDLRKTKDLSYQKILEKLFDPKDKEKDLEKSSQYGVPVYTLEGEDFYIFLRCQNEHHSTSKIRRNCYTLISNKHYETFKNKGFIYGYKNFDLDHVLHIFEKDAYSSSGGDDYQEKNVNRIMTPYQISDSPFYSENQLVNQKDENGDCYIRNMPDYLVVFDQINDNEITEAKRLGIPIVLIDTKYYIQEIKKPYELGFSEYESTYDDYTYGSDLEEIRRMRR